MPSRPQPSTRATALVSLRVWGIEASGIPAALGRVARDTIAIRDFPGLVFAKVLGTGSGTTFAPQHADPRHWALLTCWDAPQAAHAFTQSRTVRRWDAASTEQAHITMTPIASTGQWSRREPFALASRDVEPTTTSDPVAAITRARIHPRHLPAFWRALPRATAPLASQAGLIWSLGIGEAPIGFQGTFSMWRDMRAMRQYAYESVGHVDAARAARREKWFAEELFAHLRVVEVTGSYRGRPLMS
ncbi:MAG TPA: monooxygenase [Actinomycetes bacterium]|nr:monooxygenase [Actinomycetes bacterium]